MKLCIEVIDADGGNISQKLDQLIQTQNLIMAAIDDLTAQVTGLQTQVTDLQTALDNEQAQIAALLESNAAVVTGLNNTIADLQLQISAGATAEQLQGIAALLSNISSGIATTKADLEGTVL